MVGSDSDDEEIGLIDNDSPQLEELREEAKLELASRDPINLTALEV